MDDIFCMVKEKMASDGLSQAPLLVLPGGFVEESKAFLRRANDPDCPLKTCHLEDERVNELTLLQRAMARDFPHLNRCLSWYGTMLSPATFGRVPQLTFLNRACTEHRQDWGAVGFGGQRPRVPKPYELQVVFHRARMWNSSDWGGEVKITTNTAMPMKWNQFKAVELELFEKTCCQLFGSILGVG